MLTREQFRQVIEFCLDVEERENEFSKALVKYQNNDAFRAGFCSDIVGRVISWLSNVMQDEGDYISWWMFELPEHGTCKDDYDCSIWITDNCGEDKRIVIRTIDNLYDFLVSEEHSHKVECLQHQHAGVGFALSVLKEEQAKNTEIKNEGWEDRNALMDFLDKIISNRYTLVVGEQPNYSELVKVNPNGNIS